MQEKAKSAESESWMKGCKGDQETSAFPLGPVSAPAANPADASQGCNWDPPFTLCVHACVHVLMPELAEWILSWFPASFCHLPLLKSPVFGSCCNSQFYISGGSLGLKEEGYNIPSSIIYSCQGMEQLNVSISRWMDKKDAICISHLEYYLAPRRKEILPFATMWLDLEDSILSDISQTEKDKYHMFSYVLFSHSVVSDSLRPHGLQHVRLLCPSPSSGVCLSSCPFNQQCHPTVSSSATLFSSCLQSFPASGSFPMNWLFMSGGRSVGASTSASVLPMSIQSWFPLGLTGFHHLNMES